MTGAGDGSRRRAHGAPTPEEQAELVVLDLESVIRDHRSRTLSGMRVADWKAAAYASVLTTLMDSEARLSRRVVARHRRLLIGVATVVSVGFWGAVYQADKAYGSVAAVLLGVFLLVLGILGMERGLARLVGQGHRAVRERRWRQIRSYDARIKRTRAHLEKTLKELEDVSDEVAALQERLRRGPPS